MFQCLRLMTDCESRAAHSTGAIPQRTVVQIVDAPQTHTPGAGFGTSIEQVVDLAVPSFWRLSLGFQQRTVVQTFVIPVPHVVQELVEVFNRFGRV